MINILVPTDFSDLARIAITYAVRFANKIGASVTLLHVLDMAQPAKASMRKRLQSVEQEVLDNLIEDLQKIAGEITAVMPSSAPVDVRVARGDDFCKAVIAEAKKSRAGLIIMGTRGASGLKKYIIGSNTASVIESSPVPVLAVPEFGEFKHLRNVVFATDLQRTEKELKKLLAYTGQFDAIVHLIHVTDSPKQVSFLERKIDAIVERLGAPNVIVRVLVNRNISEAIDQYITAVKADLLAMFTQEHDFYDKLFNRSLTRQIAFQSRIPLLAFKQRTTHKQPAV